jgi:transposase
MDGFGMDQLSLYNHILQLPSPWYTSAVELIESESSILVTINYQSKAKFPCPKCQKLCDSYDTRKRRWRHLDICQYKTIIESEIPRISCKEHGVLTIQVPWAEQSSRYSIIFERTVLEWAQECSILSLSRRLRISWTAINGIMYRGVKRGLKRRWEVNCKHLSVDETCIGKDRAFITILSNSNGQVIAVADGRSSDSLIQCLSTIPIHFLHKIESISLDMSPAYKKGVDTFFGAIAKKIISFDHFHIAKMLTAALDQVRKKEIQRMPPLDRLYFHKTRYTWLRNGQKLNNIETNKLHNLQGQLTLTATAWFLKEKAREIWYSYKKTGASRAWKQWIRLVNESNLKPLMSVAETIKSNLKGIINSMDKGVSNARAEAINRKIKDAGRRASGYRNLERYKTAIIFYFGQLDMAP